MKGTRYLMIAIAFTVYSCHEENSNDSAKVKQELRTREVVHLTKAQIDTRAFELGDTIILKAESELENILKTSKDSSCVPAFRRISNELFKRYLSTLQRIPFDSKRLASIPSKKEREVVDAYFYNHENHLPIASNLQADGDKDFLFTKALVIKDKNCQGCHQTMANPVLKGNLGDTIAIWDLRLTKKQAVMSFVE